MSYKAQGMNINGNNIPHGDLFWLTKIKLLDFHPFGSILQDCVLAHHL